MLLLDHELGEVAVFLLLHLGLHPLVNHFTPDLAFFHRLRESLEELLRLLYESLVLETRLQLV